MSEDILDGLNEAQRAAVTHDRGPLLIVAGAGTGKTTVLARRFAWLLQEKGLSADNVLALTFTEKAAAEMEDRVLQLLPNGTYDFWISTFHGFCQRVLEERALEIGLPNRFRLLNQTDAWLLLKRHVNKLPLDHYRPLGNPTKFLSALLTHISRAKDEGITPERYLEFAQSVTLDQDADPSTSLGDERKRLQELADCYFAYQRMLREEGNLDFGDLIVETLRLLRERPATLTEFRKRFPIIMVDEFQDTNWAQYELVKLLAGDERNLTVVGDDDQAIYKFRGASLANILQFRDDFPDAATVALTHNYRSHQEILDTAYRFIRKNDPYRLEVTLADSGLSKALVSARETGGMVRALWYRSLDEEVEAVVRDIKMRKRENATLTWNDFAILVRSNDGATPFILGLERHAVPYRFFALRGLYAKPLIVDLLALLNAALTPHESAFIWRAMSMRVFGFSARAISDVIHHANRKSLSLWSALRDARAIPGVDEATARRASSFTSHLEAIAETARRLPPLGVVKELLDKTELLADILARSDAEKTELIALLNAFVDRIRRYEASTHAPTMREFLDEIKLEIDSGDEGALDADPDAGPELVKVMTIHASKGLEFRHVYVVSLVDQRFPTRERRDAIPLPDGLVNERLPEGNAHLQEERRLFYVAMTRAKDTLTLTGAAAYGGSRAKRPSVFFEESNIDMSEERLDAGELLAIAQEDPMEQSEELAVERELYPLKKRFSFTQLAAFKKCPMQYKYAHVYKIPVLGSANKSFGQAIHRTLQDVLELHIERGRAVQTSLFGEPAPDPSVPTTGLRVTCDEALAIYEERWAENDQWYPNRHEYEQYHEKGRSAVRGLWAKWSEAPPDVLALEQPFDWKIGERSIKGSVDRMDRLPSGGIAIYDYKTGSPKDAEGLRTEDKQQLWIYQIAMETRGLKVEKLAYVYVLTGEEASVDLLEGEAREKFVAGLADDMSAILSSSFPPSPSPFICRYCDFRQVCEFKKM